MSEYHSLAVGEPAPWFSQASTSNTQYHFNTVAGRYVVLCFFGTSADPKGREMLKIITEQRSLFNDEHLAFFGVSVDPDDAKEGRVCESLPGIRFFWDFDGVISRLYGAIPQDLQAGAVEFKRFWLVLNPNLQIRAIFPALADGSDRQQVASYLSELPDINNYVGFPIQAPVIILPNVFEPALCQRLIHLFQANGGEESGFMRDVNGKTVQVMDYSHKRRSDWIIEDDALKILLQRRVIRRVVPEIKKVHQFSATRMERYLVACYSAETGGHFRPHRDDTTKGTAHREFALSVNLNDDFDGGEVGFPEYGNRTFKAPPGGAVVFSCSLLHTITPVTRGYRYAFLPFLYDEAAAALREANNPYLGDNVGHYRKNG